MVGNRYYSDIEIEEMQRAAEQRVREMQQRARSVTGENIPEIVQPQMGSNTGYNNVSNNNNRNWRGGPGFNNSGSGFNIRNLFNPGQNNRRNNWQNGSQNNRNSGMNSGGNMDNVIDASVQNVNGEVNTAENSAPMQNNGSADISGHMNNNPAGNSDRERAQDNTVNEADNPENAAESTAENPDAEAEKSTILEDIISSIGVNDDTILIIGLLMLLINQKADTTLILALAYLLI